jgi:NitT/TauT family transport system ATP-binding protein
LDSQYRKYMRMNLERIWQRNRKTILFVTHSVNEAVSLADTVYLLSSLPTKIKKAYSIGLPRRRDQHGKEFVNIVRDIERELAEEFNTSLEQYRRENEVSDMLPRNPLM